MKVFVTGATGIIGRSSVRALLADGHEVTAVARSSEGARWLREVGATPVSVDPFDIEDVRAAVAGHQTVCNFATQCPHGIRFVGNLAWRQTNRLRSGVSRLLADAAHATGVERIVQESTATLYPDLGDEWIDEYITPAPVEPTVAALQAENNIGSFAEHGGIGVCLRFGFIYGPTNAQSRVALNSAHRWRMTWLPGSPGSYISSVHEDDIGSAVVAALDVPSGVWNVVDDEPVKRRDYRRALVHAAGVYKAVNMGNVILTLQRPHIEMAARSHRVSNRLFRDLSGWSPTIRSAVEGFAHLRRERQLAQT